MPFVLGWITSTLLCATTPCLQLHHMEFHEISGLVPTAQILRHCHLGSICINTSLTAQQPLDFAYGCSCHTTLRSGCDVAPWSEDDPGHRCPKQKREGCHMNHKNRRSSQECTESICQTWTSKRHSCSTHPKLKRNLGVKF